MKNQIVWADLSPSDIIETWMGNFYLIQSVNRKDQKFTGKMIGEQTEEKTFDSLDYIKNIWFNSN